MEAVITKGDLARLSPQEKTKYYAEVCRSVGLNPFTRPFEYISLSGKLTLYARREATDQLRKMNGISLEVISREIVGDILTVHVRAQDKTGRVDEDFGAVSIKGLAGEALANATMKAITKGKRRVTLSISGLGFLDESELEGIPAHERAAPADTRPQLDAFAGEQRSPFPASGGDRLPSGAGDAGADPDTGALERDGRAAAADGIDTLRGWFRSLTQPQRDAIGALIGDIDRPGELLSLAQQIDDARATESPAGIPPAAAPRPADAAAPAGVRLARQRADTIAELEKFDAHANGPAPRPDPVWQAEFAALVPKPSADGDATDWSTYAQGVAYLIGQAGKADLATLEVSRHPHLRRLREEEPETYRWITVALGARAKELAVG